MFTESNVSSAAVAGPFVNDQEHLTYRDNGGIIWDNWFYLPDKQWYVAAINLNGPLAVTDAQGTASPFTDSFWALDQLHAAWRDNGGIIWDFWYDGHSQSFNLQKINLCPKPTGDPSCDAATGRTNGPQASSGPFVNTFVGFDQEHFAYRDTDGGIIWDSWYDNHNQSWNCQQINGKNQNRQNCPQINLAENDGQPAVEGPFVDTFWGLPLPPAPFGPGLDQQHFAYRDKDGVIWDYWYDYPSWNLQKINLCPKPTGDPSCDATTGRTNGPQASSGPFVNTFVGLDQEHFAYRDTDGGIIWDSWYDNHNQSWNCQQINGKNQNRQNCPQINLAENDGQPAVEGPFVTTFVGLEQQHFAYRDKDGVIWDYWYDYPSWNLQKINLCPKPTGDPSCDATTGRTNGPEAVAGPFVNTLFGLDQQHFTYRDSGGIIWDSWYDNHNQSWNCQQINGENQNRPSCPQINATPVTLD